MRLHGAEQFTEAGLDTTVDPREATDEDLGEYEAERRATAGDHPDD